MDNAANTQILRSLEIRTANGQNIVHRYFHTEVLSQRHVFTQTFTHMNMHVPRDGFTRKDLHAQVFLHRDAFTQKTFTHRSAGTRCLRIHTVVLLQRNAFTRFCAGFLLTQSSLTRRSFYSIVLFRRDAFTQKYICTKSVFYTQILLQRGIFARILSRRDAFTHGCFETRTHLGKRLEARFGEGSSYFGIRFPSIMFLQTDAVTYKCFYTGRGLHTEMVLGREMILQRDVFTYRRSYTEILSTQRFFCTRAL